MKHIKRILIILSCITLIGMTGCSNQLPEYFPDSEQKNSQDTASDSSVSLESAVDITPVNFYFDNIENTKLISYDSVITSGFIQAVINTNRSSFATTDYHLELDNNTYSITRNEQPLEDTYLTDDFYINNSTTKSRENPGILNLLFDETNPQVNMDAVNVIFTDLSEKNIDKVARTIREKYLSSEEYNACVIAVSMKTQDKFQPFFISTSNNNIIEVGSQKLENRFYYLIMLGPTSKLSAYIHCLKANLNNSRPAEGTDYYITDYDYTQHTFDIEEDLDRSNFISTRIPDFTQSSNISGSLSSSENTAVSKATQETVSAPEKDMTAQRPAENNTATNNVADTTAIKEEQSSQQASSSPSEAVTTPLTTAFLSENEQLFRTYTIRLDEAEDDYLKKKVWHLVYNKNSTGDESLSPKGYGSNSLDFSLQADLDLSNSLNGKNIHYISMAKKADGTVIYEGFPDTTTNIDTNDVFFSFGADDEVKFYQPSGEEWVQLDNKRVKSLIKEVSTDSGHLSIISNNSDEGNTKSLYITVPVYQIVVKKNFTPEWIDKRAYVVGQDSNGLDRYRKTSNLRQFYCLLFGINIENRDGDFFVDETIMERNSIGYVRILITNL